MIARKKRLPIAEARKKQIFSYSSPLFLLKIFNSQQQYNRFAVVLGKNVSKKATERHLWKRRILSLAEKMPNHKKDILFIVSPNIIKCDYQTLRREIDKATAKIENK